MYLIYILYSLMMRPSLAFRDQPLGELALSSLALLRCFRKYDMDYCCGGKQTTARAASRKELDVEGY